MENKYVFVPKHFQLCFLSQTNNKHAFLLLLTYFNKRFSFPASHERNHIQLQSKVTWKNAYLCVSKSIRKGYKRLWPQKYI